MTALTNASQVFDPLAPEFLADPYPTYQRLRDAGPAVRAGAAQWVIARHAQVAALLRDDRLSSQWPEPFQQMRVGAGPAKSFLLHALLHRDGPDHRLLRGLLGQVMQLNPMGTLRQTVARVVAAQLDRSLPEGRLEVMADLALPVPAAVACELVGIPAEDRPLVQAWGLDLIRAFTVILPEPERPLADAAVAGLRDYLDPLLAAPPAGSRLAEVAGALRDTTGQTSMDRATLVDNVIFLLVSGFTTTVHFIATACAILLRHPAAVAALRADRSLIPRAVDEALRYDAPIQHISRHAVAAIEIAGATIRPGRVVHLLLGSANHDERQFSDPQRFDIRRHPNPHVSFGAGVHGCLGASLGRMEAVAVLSGLLDRCRVIELDGEPVRRPMQVFRTYERIPVRVR